ncbi:MAG: hypothetical protein AAF715_25655 [Myxococcota bacterium]
MNHPRMLLAAAAFAGALVMAPAPAHAQFPPQPGPPPPGYRPPPPGYQQPPPPGYGQPGYAPGYRPPPPGYRPPPPGGFGPPPPQQPRKRNRFSGEDRQEDHIFSWMTFSAGITGGLGGSFIGRPDDQTLFGQEVSPGYPGFGGFSPAIGAQFEVRFLGYVGVEMDFLYVGENGSTTITVLDHVTRQETEFDINIGHRALHVPLYLKGVFPGRWFSPMVMIGPEFVSPLGAARFSIEGENNTPTRYGAFAADGYTMIGFGIGGELNLPIPFVDLRLPISLRGAYNPGAGDTRTERVIAVAGDEPQTLAAEFFSTAFEWNVRLHAGLSANF